MIGGGSGTRINAGSFLPIFGATSCGAGSEAQCWTPLPLSGSISNLYVSTDNDPDAGAGWRVTVRKNGTDTAVRCDVIGVGTFTCQDTGDSVAFNAGDKLSVQITVAPGFTTPSKFAVFRFTTLYTQS